MRASIIIPCYNVQEELVQCAVKSAVEQDFSDYEVILVDDGSEEKYHQCLEELERKYEIVRLITTENQGVSAARNTGVSCAQGEYVAFLDADDAVSPYFLCHAWQIAVKTGAELVIGGSQSVETIKDTFLDFSSTPCEYRVYKNAEVSKLKTFLISSQNLIRFSDANIPRGPAARLLKKDIAARYKFPLEIRISEDIIWNMELISFCKKVVLVFEKWYLYRHNPWSATHKYNADIYQSVLTSIDSLTKLLDLDNAEIYKCYMEFFYDHISYIWICFLRYLNAPNRKEIKRELYGQPWNKLVSRRFFRLANFHSKRFCIFYRLHLLDLFFILRGIKQCLKGNNEYLPRILHNKDIT